MYNQEIKEKFINFIMSTGWSDSCISMFYVICESESAIDKDFAQMDVSEALEAMSHLSVSTYSSAYSRLSLARRYVEWCRDNRVFDNVNIQLLSIGINDIDSSSLINELTFRSEDDFIQSMRSVRPFDDGYYEVAALALAWIGLNQQQIMDLKTTDVDFENKTVFVKDIGTIHISDAICEVLYIYNKTKVASRDHKNGARNVYHDDSFGTFMRKFVPADKLGVRQLEKQQVQGAVHKMNKAYQSKGNGPKFTIPNVVMSGGLCRVWELEKSGVNVFQAKNKELVANAYRAKAKLHEVLWVYRNYKRAYNL